MGTLAAPALRRHSGGQPAVRMTLLMALIRRQTCRNSRKLLDTTVGKLLLRPDLQV